MSKILRLALFLLFFNTILFASYTNSSSKDFTPKEYLSIYYSHCVNGGFQDYEGTVVYVKNLSDGYVRIGDDIYTLSKYFTYGCINTQKTTSSGYISKYVYTGTYLLLNYNNDFETYDTYCEQYSNGQFGNCSSTFKNGYSTVNISYVKKYTIQKIKTCKPDENFNTETKQCQSCSEGYSWDAENNRCYKDCSDVNKNKWGWTDGTCTDCSKETTDDGVSQCYCKGIGSSYKTSHVTVCPGGGSICITSCDDGSQFNFKKPNTPDIPKPDNNNTAPNNPGGGNNQGGDTGGSGGNSGGGSGGNQGGGSGGNGLNSGGGSGGQDNQSGDTGGSGGNNNGNNQGNGNSGGGSGGSGSGNGKDKDAKFNPDEFDDGGADKERDGLFGDIKDHINSNLSKFDGISQSINQFMDNVKGKGFDKVKADIKNKCPITREIPLPNGSSKPVTVDYCDIVSPVSEVTYYAFYIGFSVGGFLLFLKLLLLSF